MAQSAQKFKQGSKGYESMGAAVKVFRAFEMAQSAMSMVEQMGDMGSILAQFLGMETAKTTAKVASNTAQQASDASAAVVSGAKSCSRCLARRSLYGNRSCGYACILGGYWRCDWKRRFVRNIRTKATRHRNGPWRS
jgi:hypothetical protein